MQSLNWLLLQAIGIAIATTRAATVAAEEEICQDTACKANAKRPARSMLQKKSGMMTASTLQSSREERSVNADSYSIAKRDGHKVKYIGSIPVYNSDLKIDPVQDDASESTNVNNWFFSFPHSWTDQELDGFCTSLPGDAGCVFKGHPSEKGLALVEILCTEDELNAIVENAPPGVSSVEPEVEMKVVPELDQEPLALADTSFKAGVGDHAGSDRSDTPWGLDKIDGLEYDYSYNPPGTGVGVHVYVGDTGIRATHEEFEGRVVPTFESFGGKGHPKECGMSDKKCAVDQRGHGTHIAGIIAGKTYGVAKGATVHSVKIINNKGFVSSAWLLHALDFVASNAQHPAVLSLSLGFGGTSPAIASGVEAVVNSGVTVVVAAGNEAQNACGFTPAQAPLAFTVGAINKKGSHARFSNYGACNNIYAPGVNIESADALSDSATVTMTGTSMACPFVSGAAALVLEEHPDMEPEDVKSLLLQEAVKDEVRSCPKETLNARLYINPEGVGTLAIMPPTPAPTPATPAPTPSAFVAFRVDDGDCTVPSDAVTCVQSPNFPEKYADSGHCSISVNEDYFAEKTIDRWVFKTEGYYDTLAVNGKVFSGTGDGLHGLKPTGKITWSSDGAIRAAGWKLCASGTATPAPTMPWKCEGWCKPHKSAWPEKCLWKTNVCTGCKQCCQSWCKSSDSPWEEICTWGGCRGCQECK